MNAAIVLSAISAALAVCALLTALIALRAARRCHARCDSLDSSIAALHREVEMLASISVRTGRRLQRVENEFGGVTERVDLVESRTASRSESLDHAIDLARRGADSDRLEQQFGLSSGEADLVARLHGRAKET